MIAFTLFGVVGALLLSRLRGNRIGGLLLFGAAITGASFAASELMTYLVGRGVTDGAGRGRRRRSSRPSDGCWASSRSSCSCRCCSRTDTCPPVGGCRSPGSAWRSWASSRCRSSSARSSCSGSTDDVDRGEPVLRTGHRTPRDLRYRLQRRAHRPARWQASRRWCCGSGGRRGVERQQIKWVALRSRSSWPPSSLSTIAGAIGLDENLIDTIVSGIAFIALPVSVAIAVLQYHLYDLDVVVKKALVAGALVLLVIGGVRGRRRAPGRGHLRQRELRLRVHRRAGARARVPAGDAVRAAHRRSPRLRQAGDPVRGADRVLRTRRRVVCDGGRPRSDGADPRPGHGRRLGSCVAPHRQRAAAGGLVADGRRARGRRGRRERGPPDDRGRDRRRGPRPGRAPRGPLGRDAAQRPDEPVEGTPGPRPRVAGRPGPSERPPRRGAPRLAAAAGHGAGPGAPPARTQHPRRRAAAAGRAVREDAARARSHGARPRQGRRDAHADRRRDPDGARRPPRPRARHLPAAPGGQGSGRRAGRPGAAVARPDHDPGRRPRPLRRPRWRRPSTSRASRPSRTSPSTRRRARPR